MASGIGDTALIVKASIFKPSSIVPKEIFLLAGTELPTGKTGAKDAIGNRLPLSQQPGSDSLDWLFGAAAVWSLWEVSLYADAVYKRAGRETYTFGDSLSLNAGANRPMTFAPSLSAAAELSFEAAGRDRSRFGGPGVLPGGTVRDTGGETLSISPSLQWRPRPFISMSLGVQVPFHQNLRGTQLKSGMSPHAALSARFP